MVTTYNVLKKNSGSDLIAKVDAALTAASFQDALDVDTGIYSIDGMSGKKYRYFINNLVRIVDNPRYLEIGSWAGSTLCSAIYGNKLKAVAIDNWSEFGGPRDQFIQNVEKFSSPQTRVFFIESDFRKVDYDRDIRDFFNIYLFDGPHLAEDQYDGLAMVLKCLDKQFVFIVDDWNWDRVREGTFAAIQKCGLNVLYSAEIRTTLNGHSPPQLLPITSWRDVRNADWHNGYYIAVLEKR